MLKLHKWAASAITLFALSISLKSEFSFKNIELAYGSNSFSSTSAIKEIVLQASLVMAERKSKS